MSERLDGRVALITGGARGIGAATAERLSAEGASVVVADLDPVGDAIACDVTSAADVEAAVSACTDRFGRLDVLVTCAGVIRDDLVHKMPEEGFDAVVATHLKGTFLCAQAAQRVMVRQRDGRMVLLSSSVAARGNRGQVNYSAAKAGIEAMARTLALELGRFGIRVNAVAPGFIETRMTRSIAERAGTDYEALKAERSKDLALGRVGQPEEVAAVIAFLASDDASYVTGQTVTVRGSV
jgi:3-oxoacyl-[acyl-carrier protein] reductase